jgi:hypothetical protein
MRRAEVTAFRRYASAWSAEATADFAARVGALAADLRGIAATRAPKKSPRKGSTRARR